MHYNEGMPIHKDIFSDKEAWLIFRVAAFGEAFGWTLLIGSLVAQKYVLHGNNILVLFAGQIHGLLFFAYIAAVLATYASMALSFKKAFVVGLMSVPPYGTLLAEIVLSKARKKEIEKSRPSIRVFGLIKKRGHYLFIEKKDDNSWSLPGTTIKGIDIENELKMYCKKELGIRSPIISLQYIKRHQIKKEQFLDFFFAVSTVLPKDIERKIMKNTHIEKVSFLSAKSASLDESYRFLAKKTDLFVQFMDF